MERILGDILSVRRDKGFCFIVGPDGCSHFLHFREIREHRIPVVGDLYLFSVRASAVKPGLNEAYDAQLARGVNNSALQSPSNVQGAVQQ